MKRKPSPKWYFDGYGLFSNCAALVFVELVVFVPPMACLAGVDPIKLILPEQTELGQQIISFSARLVFFSMAGARILATTITIHFAFFTLILYSKKCVGYLKGYRRALVLHDNPSSLSTKLHTLSELEMYRTICIVYRIASYAATRTTATLMGPGLFIQVTCNYVVVMLYDKIPLFLYLSIVILAISVIILIMIEVPQAGRGHSKAKDVLKYWRKTIPRRKGLRQKVLDSFRPVEICIGSFAIMNKDTFFSYVQQILSTTVDFVLLL